MLFTFSSNNFYWVTQFTNISFDIRFYLSVSQLKIIFSDIQLISWYLPISDSLRKVFSIQSGSRQVHMTFFYRPNSIPISSPFSRVLKLSLSPAISSLARASERSYPSAHRIIHNGKSHNLASLCIMSCRHISCLGREIAKWESEMETKIKTPRRKELRFLIHYWLDPCITYCARLYLLLSKSLL